MTVVWILREKPEKAATGKKFRRTWRVINDTENIIFANFIIEIITLYSAFRIITPAQPRAHFGHSPLLRNLNFEFLGE